MLAHEIEVIVKYYSSTWHSAYAKITVMQCESPGWLFGRAHASTPASLWRVGCNILKKNFAQIRILSPRRDERGQGRRLRVWREERTTAYILNFYVQQRHRTQIPKVHSTPVLYDDGAVVNLNVHVSESMEFGSPNH